MCEKMTTHVVEEQHRGQDSADSNQSSANCACQACMERKFLEQEQIRDVQDLQKCWMQLRHSIRQMYRDRLLRDLVTGKGKKIDQNKIKDLVNKLASRDPHQLYQRLECQAREHVMDLKVQLLQILVSPEELGLMTAISNNNSTKLNQIDNEKSLTAQLTADVAKHFISSLLSFAGQFFDTVDNMRCLLDKLEKEHLDKFGITWRIVNCNLFDTIIFQDPLIQVSLPAIYKQLGFSSLKLSEINFDELSNRNLIPHDLSEMMKSFVELDSTMAACREQMGKAQERMEDYMAQQMKIYQATLKAKQKMLKEDLEFFKHQRKLLEEYVSKKKEMKKTANSDEELSAFAEALRGLLANNRPIRTEHSASTAECPRCRLRHCPCDECTISHLITCGLIGDEDDIELPNSLHLLEQHNDDFTSNSSSSDSDDSEYSSIEGGGCTIEENYANMDIVCRKSVRIKCNGQKMTKVETTILPSSLYPFQNGPASMTRHVYHAYGDWEVSADPSAWFFATSTTNRHCPSSSDHVSPPTNNNAAGGGTLKNSSASSSLSLLRCRAAAAKRQSATSVGVAKLKPRPFNNQSSSSTPHQPIARRLNSAPGLNDKPDLIRDILKEVENNNNNSSAPSVEMTSSIVTCQSALIKTRRSSVKCEGSKKVDKQKLIDDNKNVNKSKQQVVSNHVDSMTTTSPVVAPPNGGNPFLNSTSTTTTTTTTTTKKEHHSIKCTTTVQASSNFDKVPPELLKIMKDEKLAKALALAASKRNLTANSNSANGANNNNLAQNNKNCLTSTEPYWKDLNLDVETVRKIYNSQQTHTKNVSSTLHNNNNSAGNGNGTGICTDGTKNPDPKNNNRQSQSVGTQVDPVADDDEDSWSDRSSGSPKDSKHCDCCYCEMFGQGNNRFGRDDFPQIRERLRLKLKKKGGDSTVTGNDCQANNQPTNQNNPPGGGAGGGQQTVLSEQVKGYRGSAPLDALLEYIEGGATNQSSTNGNRRGAGSQQKLNSSSSPSTNSSTTGGTPNSQSAKSSAKRQRQKHKKVNEKSTRCESTNQNPSLKNSPTNQSTAPENLSFGEASPKKKGKKKLNMEETLNVDEVFKPKDIDLNSADLDEADKEVEIFKRFVLDCRPLQNREKVQLNLTNLLNFNNLNRRNNNNSSPPKPQRQPQTLSC